MSPFLVEQLYRQIKQVIARSIAVTDRQGTPYEGANDFDKEKKFPVSESFTRDKRTVGIEGKPRLRAIPLLQQDLVSGLLVLETTEEDSQTIQVISSLAELIIQQFVDSHKPRPDAVDLLMNRLAFRPQTIEQDELEQQLAALGFRVDVPRVAMIFRLSGFWENYLQQVGQPLGEKKDLIAAKKNDIEQTLSSFFSKNQDNLIGYIGNDLFLVLKDISSTDITRFNQLLTTHFSEITDPLKNIYIQAVKVGLSQPVRSPDGLLQSAREALQVLEIGEKIDEKRNVYRKDDLGIMPLLLSESLESKMVFTGSIIENLQDPELLETLQTFLENDLNLTKTSERLKVHRNTVIYRLDKIAELLERDPRKFEDAVALYIALRFRQVFRDG